MTIDRDADLAAVLRRLDGHTVVPEDDEAERALLGAFDESKTRRLGAGAPRVRHAFAWVRTSLATAAVLFAAAAGLVWMTPHGGQMGRVGPPSPHRAPAAPLAASLHADRGTIASTQLPAGVTPVTHRTRPARAARPAETTEFVSWPGATALPPFESGELVRIDIPASLLPSLGFMPRAGDGAVVRADVIVGQDGFARAVRLVQ